MAVKACVVQNLAKGVIKATWENITGASGDTYGALDASMYPDKTCQVIGTFGNVTITIQGSNDNGTTYTDLNDSRGEGYSLAFTAANILQILENPQKIRPSVSTATGTTDLDVIIIAQSGKR